MASFYTPASYKKQQQQNYRDYDSTAVHTSALKKSSSITHLKSMRNSMNELIKGVDAKRQVSNQAVSEVIDTNKQLIDVLSYQEEELGQKGAGYGYGRQQETQASIDLGFSNYNPALSKSVYGRESTSTLSLIHI